MWSACLSALLSQGALPCFQNFGEVDESPLPRLMRMFCSSTPVANGFDKGGGKSACTGELALHWQDTVASLRRDCLLFVHCGHCGCSAHNEASEGTPAVLYHFQISVQENQPSRGPLQQGGVSTDPGLSAFFVWDRLAVSFGLGPAANGRRSGASVSCTRAKRPGTTCRSLEMLHAKKLHDRFDVGC